MSEQTREDREGSEDRDLDKGEACGTAGARSREACAEEKGFSDTTAAQDFKERAAKLSRKFVASLHLGSSSNKQQTEAPVHSSGGKATDRVGGGEATNARPDLSSALLADCQYDMSHQRRGRAVLINNANFEADTDMPRRLSTATDVDGLGRVLKEARFLVQVFEDLTCEQMKRLIRSLSKEDHSDADCLLIAVLTHGDDGEIYGTDGPMPAREITAPFRGDACRSLLGKPKLFIFQACRGIMVDQGVAMDRRDVDEPDALVRYESAKTIPVEADFLVAYSSPEGYASWRNATSGAWFIQSLVQAMEACAASWEFTRILTLVNRMVALQYESLSENTFMTRKKQMPCFVSTLTKELHFRPKGAP